MRHRFEAAHGALGDREGVLIELASVDGTMGIGEASPMTSIGGGTLYDVLTLLGDYGRAALGDGYPLDALPLVGPGVAALRCGIEVALLDLEGRRRGVPIAQMFAAQPAQSVEVNAIIGVGEPSEVAGWGLEAVASGYRVLKIKVGAGSLADDVARVTALREACPEARVRLDANGAWDEGTARAALDAFAGVGVELLEQPVPAAEVEVLARLHGETSIPLGADEALRDVGSRRAVLDASAADVLVLKPMVLGGLLASLEVAREGARVGMRSLATTTFDSSVGTAAALHLAAALGGAMAHGLGTGEHLAGDLVRETLVARDGRMRVPSGGGLGIEVDRDELDRWATDGWRELRL